MKRVWTDPKLWVAALLVVLVAVVAPAQETTGAITGTVVDDADAPLPGVQVEANGPLGRINVMTDSEGRFRFPRVVPGQYEVIARMQGFLDAQASNVRVTLGQATTVDFAMQQSFSEEIVVTADTLAIDFTESQTATSIRKYEIDFLPRGRDFTDVVSFAAGAVEDLQAGGISIDGASGLENRFVIDGIDTTDPQIGDNAVPMRAEMFEEVQVKSAGYAAEYGGSTGGVINAVTRSGGNELHGALFVDYQDNDWLGDERPELEDDGELYTYPWDDETRIDPGFFLSGPIVKDRLWFFASYQPGLRTTDRTVTWSDPELDRETFSQDHQVDYAVANVTANLGSQVLVKLGANLSPYETDGLLPNRDGLSNLAGQENWAPLGEEGERETYSLTADWIPSESFVVAARAGFYHTNVEDTGFPTFDLIHNYSTGSDPGFLDLYGDDIPAEFQNDRGWVSDVLNIDLTQKNVYERTAWALDGTWYAKAAGDHSIKLGFQTEEIFNDVQSGYNADRILYYWNRSYTTTTGESVRGQYGHFRLLNISTLGEVTTTNDAIFLQDTWNVAPTVTLNLGVRAEHESVPNYGATGPDPAIEFDYGDKIAPRLGFAWDILGDATWKVYGSYGIYYDVTKYELPRGSFGGAKWVDYYFTFDAADPGLNNSPGCRTGENTIFESPDCGAGTLIEAVDRRFNSVDPLYDEIIGAPGIDPDLKPMESWELQLGVDHQLTPNIQVGARYVHKEIVRAIEDVGFLYPGVGEVYIIANPGEGLGISAPGDTTGLVYPKPEREYDALELTFDKRFSENWSLRAYYTWSRLYGNYSGLANSDEQNSFGNPLDPVNTSGRRAPNVSRLYDTITSMYDADGNHVYGELATNRTHQLGAQLLYSFDFGLSVGATQYIGSGTPRSEIATVPVHSYFYPRGRGNLGETPWLTQTDLSLWQKFNLSKVTFSIGLTVLNLFDEDTVTRYWGTRVLQDLPVTDADFVGGFDYDAALAETAASNGLDPAYNQPDTYQAPREVRLSFKLEF